MTKAERTLLLEMAEILRLLVASAFASYEVERIRKPLVAAMAALALDAVPSTTTEYERGRLSVRQELTAAVDRFNDDDSLGIGQLIEVIAPWLLDAPA
jgi:hypothetical protein